MKETRTYGKVVSVEVEVYNVCKYTAKKGELEEFKTVRYDGVTEWAIITGEDAEEIERETDGSCIDDFHEYLEIHFEDGETATFRNSYVDMFRA